MGIKKIIMIILILFLINNLYLTKFFKCYATVNCTSVFYDPLESLSIGSSKSDSICKGYYQRYRFSITNGKQYKVTVSPFFSNDPDLYIYSSNTVSPDNYSKKSTNGAGSTDEITFSASYSGYYYAAVFGYRGDSSDVVGYSIKVVKIDTNPTPSLSVSKSSLRVNDSITFTCNLNFSGSGNRVAFFVNQNSSSVASQQKTTNSSGIATWSTNAKESWRPSVSVQCRNESSGKTSSWKNVTVNSAPKPDISLSPSSVNESVTSGKYIVKTITVRNYGDATLNISSFNAYHDNPSSPPWIGPFSHSSLSVSSNSSKTFTFNINAVNLPTGTRSGRIKIYSNDSESPTTINVTVNVKPAPKPDLIIQSENVNPSNVENGSNINISCYVKNQGDASSNSSYVKYYLSTNTSYSSDDKYLGSDSVSSLTSGSRSSESETVTIPSNTSEGRWYIIFRADANDNVSESNENNNVEAVSLNVSLKKGTITGGVRDNYTKEPIYDAAVRLEINGNITDYVTYSKSDGTYSISNVTPGTYRLTGLKSGYDNWYKEGVTISSGQTLSGQNIAMNRKSQNPPQVQVIPEKTKICHGWNLLVNAIVSDPEDDNYSCKWKVGSGLWNSLSGKKSEYSFEITSHYFYPVDNTIFVSCTDDYNRTGQGSIFIYDYDVPNDKPGSLYPGNGQEIDYQESSYDFVFAGVENAHHYRILISDNSSFSNTIHDAEYAGSPAVINSNLLMHGNSYFWKICPENILKCKGQESCAQASFTIKPKSGLAKVSKTEITDNVLVGNRYHVSFTLEEITGSPVTFSKIICAVYDCNNYLFNLENSIDNKTIPANGSWKYDGTGFAVGKISKTGTYKLILRGNGNEGWKDFAAFDAGINPALLNVGINPQVSISDDNVSQGGNIVFSGNGFSGSSEVSLNFIDKIVKINTNEDGTFIYNWMCTENTKSGEHTYKAIDSLSNTESNLIQFKVWIKGKPDSDIGIIARTIDSSKVYWIKYNKKFWIKEEPILINLGYSLNEIKWYGSGALDFAKGTDIVDEAGNFVYRHVDADKSTVYRVKNGKSYAYLNWEEFINDGFSETDIYWASEIAFSWLTDKYKKDGYEDLEPPNISKYLTPLYRLYKSFIDKNTRDHFYTTNFAEMKKASKNESEGGYGYKYIGIECYIYKEQHSGCVPLYRLYNNEINSHFYTIKDDEKDSKISDGYKLEGSPGFIYQNEKDGLVPLYRLWERDTGHYFMGIGKHEYDNALNHASWSFEDQGIVGFVSADGFRDAITFKRPQGNFAGVDLGTGAFRGLNSLDLLMKGRGPSLSFSHFYNTFKNSEYPMGQGWNHNLNIYAHEDKNGNIYVYWANGITLFKKENAGYKDTSGNHDIVNKNSSGFSVKKKNQTIFRFNQYTLNESSSNKTIYLIKTITDWTGKNSLTFTYHNDSLNLISVEDTMNRKLELGYNASNLLKDVKEVVNNKDQRSVSFLYENGLLATFKDACNENTKYSYYKSSIKENLIEKITYPEENTLIIDYDSLMRVFSVKQKDEPASIIKYEPSSKTTTITDPKGVVYKYIHDSQLRLQSLGGHSQYSKIEYTDANNPNNPTLIEDKRGNETKYKYDDMGNIEYITNAIGNKAYFEYNSKNLISKSYEFNDSKENTTPTIYNYDENDNRLRKITDPEKNTIEYNYDNNQQIESIVNGNNKYTYYEYDNFGNLKSVTNSIGNSISYTNDYAGRTTVIKSPDGIITDFEYNNNDHLTNKIHYDKNGNQMLNVKLNFNKNGNNESVSWNNEGVESKTEYIYDDLDRLYKVIKPGDQESFLYTYRYYENNLLKTIENPDSLITSYNYDEYNRLKKIDYQDQGCINIERDENGNIDTVSTAFDNNKKSYFIYNKLNLVQKYTDPFGNIVKYDYNETNRLEKITYPNEKVVKYSYYKNGRLKEVVDWLQNTTKYIYDKAGNLKEIQRNNNTKVVYEYDDASQLYSIQDLKADNSIICSYNYEFYNSGNIKSVTIDEPIASNFQSKEINYEYNKKNNRLLYANHISYSYDNKGNRIIKNDNGETKYLWGIENMLTKIQAPYGTRYYRYDGFNNRIASVNGSFETRYVLDLVGSMSQVLAETDKNNTIKSYYIYGIGLISKILPDDTIYYYHYNNRGDTIALTDKYGNITDKYAYDAFGNILSSEGNTDNPFKFVGRYGVMDEGNGLYFMRARYYDAEVGRFLSEDPLVFGGGDWNLYAYVSGNPIINIDPIGRNKFLSKGVEYFLSFEDALYNDCKSLLSSAWIADKGGELIYNAFLKDKEYTKELDEFLGDIQFGFEFASEIGDQAMNVLSVVKLYKGAYSIYKSPEKATTLVNELSKPVLSMRKPLFKVAKFSSKRSKEIIDFSYGIVDILKK